METPRKFITAKLCTDEDPGLRIESFAVINLRGVSTNKTIIYFIAMQTYKELNIYLKNSLIIQEQNTKKNHKRVVVLYVIKNHVNLHKL